MPTALFNGRDLAGWTVFPADAKSWTVRDKLLVCSGKPLGYLATVSEHGDYALTVEYRYPPGTEKANSGVLIHCGTGDRQWPTSIEVQLRAGRAGDLLPNPDESGKLPKCGIDAARLDPMDKSKRRHMRTEPAGRDAENPVGEWNRLAIVCKGGDLRVMLNSVLVNEAMGGELKRGRIALQCEGAVVEFRKVELA